MRKLTLFLSAFLITVTCYATSTNNLTIALQNAFDRHISLINQNPFAIIYGGQDFSHPQMADADESFWSGQPRLIG